MRHARRGDASGSFRFERTVPFERARFTKEAEGTYVTDATTLLLAARARKARVFDATSGALHACYPKKDGSYMMGPGLAIAYPQTGLLRLLRGSSGAVTSIVVAEAGRPDQTARRADPHAEDIQLPADGATLAATLYLPAGTGPFPGVVFVHGSGKVTRDDWWQQAMARAYLREGVAVMLYDKRGTGGSTGTYVGPGAADSDNTSPANLARLAADARVAAAALAARPEIDRRRVGLTGISQAGWIMPLAAAHSKDVSFLVSFSGPAVTTYLEDVHSRMMGDGEREGGPKLADVDEVVHRMPIAPPKTWRMGDPGFDPAPSLASLKIPSLFFYGALDTSIPAAESVRVLERIGKRTC